MPLFSKKQPAQPQPRRNPAAEHNARLRAGSAQQTPPAQKPVQPISATRPQTPPSPVAAQTGPGQRLRDLTRASASAPLPLPDAPARTSLSGHGHDDDDRFDWKLRQPTLRKSLRAASKLYKLFSMIVDVVLILLVLVLAVSLKNANDTLNHVLSGLYENFVVMDSAVISTNIRVEDASIPLDFTLPVVQSETYVTLTRDVTIRNATVGVLSLPTTVTLPAGTTLPVALSMEVPVQTTLLVDLEVPVNIKLAEANPPPPAGSLHEAFLGLQDTIGPFYCLFDHPADSPAAFACDGNRYVPTSRP